MTKQDLFKKYSINESHNTYESIDSWFSIEIYRLMHNGNLPPKDDFSIKWVTDFLDKQHDAQWWVENVMSRQDWGSLWLTSKRLIYMHAEKLLKELSC